MAELDRVRAKLKAANATMNLMWRRSLRGRIHSLLVRLRLA